MLAALILIPLIVCAKSWKELGFVDSDRWLDERELCRGERTGLRTGLCLFFNDYLFFRKVEIVSEDPIIVVYRNAINRKLIKRIVNSLEKKGTMEELRILGEKGIEMNSNSEIRRANGTWMPNYSSEESMELYFSLQRLFLPLDLRTAEPFQILRYDRGGFYVPHTDFINEKRAGHHDLKMPGTRIATAIVSLRRAKRGGGLTFPYLSSTVMLNAGDVALLFNETPNKKMDLISTHASCRVMEGMKLDATLWIHSNGNELRALTRGQSWDIHSLLRRKRKTEDEKMFEISLMNYATYFDGQSHQSSEEIIKKYREGQEE